MCCRDTSGRLSNFHKTEITTFCHWESRDRLRDVMTDYAMPPEFCFLVAERRNVREWNTTRFQRRLRKRPTENVNLS